MQGIVDLKQFIDPVATSMTAMNSLQPACLQLCGELRRTQNRSEMHRHLLLVVCYQKIFTRTEEAFGIVQRSGDQRNSASKSFERANCWNPRQTVGIRRSRNMERDP